MLHVNFGYEPGRTIINDFTATAQPGQKVAIVGPTGAGKTTIVNLLERFYEVDGGRITLDGRSTLGVPRENVREQFGMPTCWPFDSRSDPTGVERPNIIKLDIDLLLGKRTLGEVRQIVEDGPVSSVPGVTFQSQLSDEQGNVLQIVPGQGYRYLARPPYSVMKVAAKVGAALECGGVVINGASFFRSFEMPFGGYKYSGIGTEGVMSTFDEVTHTKTIVLKNII